MPTEKKRMRRRKKTDKDYISNKDMYAEVLECQKNDKISEKLGSMFMNLATRYSTKPSFVGYTYRDEMISNGVVACCAALYKFDSEKSQNPFAYYTSIIHNAFIQILNKERTHQEIRDVLLIENDYNPSNSYVERHKDDVYE